MAHGFVSLYADTYGGVYYTSNFTLSGAITWTKLTTTGLVTLRLTVFHVDPFDPINRQYALTSAGALIVNRGNTISTRNGGDWSTILDIAACEALTGETNSNYIASVWPDPTTPGTLWTLYSGFSKKYLLRSVDYGATWTVQNQSTSLDMIEVQAYGNDVWWTQTNVLKYSPDAGATVHTIVAPSGSGFQVYYPHDTTIAYVRYATGAGGGVLHRVVFNGSALVGTQLFAPTELAENFVGNGESGHIMWVDPYTPGHMRICDDGDTPDAIVHYTYDSWATYSSTATFDIGQAGQCTAVNNTNDITAVITGKKKNTTPKIYAASSETGAFVLRNGANLTAPYTDSVPVDVGFLSNYGIWVGNQPVSTGIYVYSVEMEASDAGWATDVTDYDKIGEPMGGDRASFRDMPADGFDVYHAEDVHAATPQIHAPWDEASPPGAGYGIISDGTKWEVSSGTIALTSDLHAAVTLDVDAATILDLTGQEIGLDVQNANTVLAGPASGAANEPTFRALALSNGDVDDVNITGAGTGDIIYKSSGDWVDYPLGVGIDIVNDGSSIKLGNISSGNFLQIDTDTGEIALAGTATAYEDLRVEPTVRAAAGAGVPSFEKYFDDTPGTSKGVFLYSFTDEAVAGNEKEIFFTMQMPHSWKVGSNIHFHVHFVPAATVNSSDIIFGLEYTWKGIGEVFGDTTIIYTDGTLMPDDANITAGTHYLTEFADIVPGAAASSLSSILIGRLFRNSSSGSDTYTNKVGLLYIDAHYEVDSFGSFDEYNKEMDSSLLLETGDVLLLETGDALLLE